jgi:hypothetical protein
VTRRRPGLAVLVLGAVGVLLLAAAVTMTALYARESGLRADRDRAAATREAQLDALRTQLAQLQAQHDDLAAKLKAAQDAQLDPAGYQLIKQCVQLTATFEDQIEQAIKDGKFTLPDGTVPGNGGLIFVGGDPALCSKAAKYLK